MDRLLLLLCFCIGFLTCNGKPTAVPGPCIGPDCYHGQLMHGDKAAGIDHQAEDTYLRIKEDLAAGQPETKPETPEQLGVGKMEIDIGVQGQEELKRGPILPIDAEALMHGGDGKPHDHDKPEVKSDTVVSEEVVKKGPILPIDAEALMHGGDGKPHDHDKPEVKSDTVVSEEVVKKGPILPIDAEALMHGGDGKPHDHDGKPAETEQGEEPEKRGPIMPLDAEVMMHGGDHKPHDHDGKAKTEEENVDEIKRRPILPIDAEALMHGGDHKPHQHGKQEDKPEEGKKLGPGGEEYWHGVLNHGDQELGVDHHSHDKEAAPVKYDFDIEELKQIEGVGELLAKVDFEALLKKNKDDYNKWKKDGTVGKPVEDADDSLWNQLDRVRQRYLSFGSGKKEETEEERARRFDPLAAEWEKDFMADGKDPKEDDIVHALELIGNTAPLKNVHSQHRQQTANGHVTHDES